MVLGRAARPLREITDGVRMGEVSMQWKRVALIVFGSMIVATAATSDRLDTFGEALRGLTPAQLSAFQAGLDEFNEVEEVDDGLGPVFNDRSCAACHSAPAVGGGSERMVTRFGTTTNGAFDPLG